MGKTIGMAPKSASEKKNAAMEQAEMARATALFAAKKEQYAMNLINGLFAAAGERLFMYDYTQPNEDYDEFNGKVAEKVCQDIIDAAFELADYQMQKMYKQVGE